MSRKYFTPLIEDPTDDDMGLVPAGYGTIFNSYKTLKPVDDRTLIQVLQPLSNEQHDALIAIDGVEEHEPASDRA